MVSVAVSMLPSPTGDGFERVSRTVSSASSRESSRIVTANVAAVSPAGIVTVPVVSRKSWPAMAVPSAAA